MEENFSGRSAAINGQVVDHVPSAFWLHFPEKQFFGKEAVEAHVDFYRSTDIDVVKVMNEYLYRGDNLITTPRDWGRWRPITGPNSYFRGQIDIVKRVVDQIGSEVPVIATIHG